MALIRTFAPIPTNAVQQVAISGGPTGGDFTLTHAGQTTAPIAYNASAATVQTALEALSNLAPGDVEVSGAAGGPYQVVFMGTLANTYVAPMTTDATGLTGGSSPGVDAAHAVEGPQALGAATPFANGGSAWAPTTGSPPSVGSGGTFGG